MNRSIVCVLLLASGALLAQHEYTATDIENGGRQYVNNCVYCHGPEGDQIAGVSLFQGRFKRAVSDDDIVQIIRNGVPGTGMPAQTGMNEANARTIVAYLRSAAAVPASTLTGGNAARGKSLFEGKGACATCHRVQGSGSRMGPDLSDIGMQRRAVELEKSLLDPGAGVLPQHRFVQVTPKSGPAVTGRLLNQDTFTLQLIDSQERLRTFVIADLRDYSVLKDSRMPSYKDKLSRQELADMVSYLVSLKGPNKP
ncbi:MAG: ccoP2 [Bryobacterales bacterium]|nr:ccoP2 [Bryobacterales bacterium]